MKENHIDSYCFLQDTLDSGINVVFSTALNNLNFNKNIEEGLRNLGRIREWFNVDDTVFLNQVHGTDILKYDGSEITIMDGDGIVTNSQGCAIGIFTADCVPVLLADEEKRAVAAIHSGWKGTIGNIVSKGIDSMIENYNSNPANIKAYIGPHNRECCYEVSEELIMRFSNEDIFKNHIISNGRMLNLKSCVEIELINRGVKKENIIDLNLCTHCSEKIKLYSYRKEEEKMGRLFSFVFIGKMEG